MLAFVEQTISGIVQFDYRTADVFQKHGVSFCCQGKVLLGDACTFHGLDCEQIIQELENATRNLQVSNTLAFNEWKVDFLTDYIINVHHSYLYTALPSLVSRLDSFMLGHQKKYPELARVHEDVEKLSSLLLAHNRHEEEIIFPYIKQINTAFKKKESYGNLFVRTLRKPLSNIEKEHGSIREILENLKVLTGNFIFPPNACTNHQVLYNKLRELKDDLLQHMYLEYHILFPKALEIEQLLLGV